MWRASAYSIKGEFDLTIEDFNRVIQLSPHYAEAYNNRGAVYAAKGETSRAIEDFDRAIQLNPDYAEAYNNRGKEHLLLKEWEKVRIDLNTAKNVGINIVTSFHSKYAGVEDLEQKTGIQLPKDIADLLKGN